MGDLWNGSRVVGGLKLAAIRALRKIAASRDFALVIAHRAKPTYIACLATKLPVISVVMPSAITGVPHAAGSLILHKRLSLLAVSDAVRNDIRRCLPQWPAEKIETLHNRIDVAALQAGVVPCAAAARHSACRRMVPVIGNVGRLHPDKDQATLIQGFAAALPRLPIRHAAGDCRQRPLAEALKALAAGLGIADRVRFLGQVPDVRRYFSAFDLFALSSDHEPASAWMLLECHGRRRAGDGHRLRRRSGSRR